MMIYYFFKPMNIKQHKFIDVPLFELSSFTLYELDDSRLTTVMKGNKAVRYSNRYEVSQINYTDNSEKYISNMKANRGVYKNDIIDLKGKVIYTREDGLIFETDEAIYNKKTNITQSDREFVMYRGGDRVVGSFLKYNNILNSAVAKNITAKYQLQESKK